MRFDNIPFTDYIPITLFMRGAVRRHPESGTRAAPAGVGRCTPRTREAPGPRPGGTTAAPRGARRRAAQMLRRKRGPGDRNRRGGALRGERPRQGRAPRSSRVCADCATCLRGAVGGASWRSAPLAPHVGCFRCAALKTGGGKENSPAAAGRTTAYPAPAKQYGRRSFVRTAISKPEIRTQRR